MTQIIIVSTLIWFLLIGRMWLTVYQFRKINDAIEQHLIRNNSLNADFETMDKIFKAADIFVKRGLFCNSINLFMWSGRQFAPEFYDLINKD